MYILFSRSSIECVRLFRVHIKFTMPIKYNDNTATYHCGFESLAMLCVCMYYRQNEYRNGMEWNDATRAVNKELCIRENSCSRQYINSRTSERCIFKNNKNKRVLPRVFALTINSRSKQIYKTMLFNISFSHLFLHPPIKKKSIIWWISYQRNSSRSLGSHWRAHTLTANQHFKCKWIEAYICIDWIGASITWKLCHI